MIIKSINNPYIKKIISLKIKKTREKEGLFLIEGEHLIKEAYLANRLIEVITLKDIDYNVRQIKVSESVLKKISSLMTPQIIGVCSLKNDFEYQDKIIMLEDIQDPGNLGAIIRSAVAFNINSIIISNSSVDVYNEKVIRGTQGMFFQVNIKRSNLLEELNYLKGLGYQIILLDNNASKEITKLNNLNKVVLVFGNEGQGLSKDIKEYQDEIVKIKTNSKCESLNLSVAASIAMCEINKRIKND